LPTANSAPRWLNARRSEGDGQTIAIELVDTPKRPDRVHESRSGLRSADAKAVLAAFDARFMNDQPAVWPMGGAMIEEFIPSARLSRKKVDRIRPGERTS